jgi:tripartite-type tricarboxylate transporter receptor subunit TctC
VSVTAGGSIDTIARSYGEALSQALGQTVVIENKPAPTATSPPPRSRARRPDGYTLLATGGSTLNLNPFLYASLPFDPVKSFAPVVPHRAHQLHPGRPSQARRRHDRGLHRPGQGQAEGR